MALKTKRRYFQALIATCLMAGLWPAQHAQAQDKSKPVRFIVPFAPGGSNDIVARVLANELSIRTKRSFVVENTPGAGGTIGASAVARAEPDGSTLLLISSTFTMNSSIMKLSYDPIKSFSPVAMLGMGPAVAVVTSDLPVNTMADLVAYSKKNAGKVNFSSAGVGSFQHFAAELIKSRTGADFTVVQYKGGAPALNDVAAGNTQVTLGSLIQMQALMQAGKIKVIGVAGSRRADQIPNVQTFKEGGADVEVANWWGVLAPAGTPSGTIEFLHREINAVLNSPDIKKRLAHEGADPMPMSRADFVKFMSAETQKWAEVAKQTGIKLD